MSIRERRRSRRYPCLADARVWHVGSTNAARAVALDISEHGANLALLERIDISGDVRVGFPGPRPVASRPIPASIARTVELPHTKGGPGAKVGISFIKPQSRLPKRLSIIPE